MSHPVLSRCPLFAGIAAAEIAPLLECLGARRVAVEKNQTIFWEGDAATDMGIVLEGAVQVAAANSCSQPQAAMVSAITRTSSIAIHFFIAIFSLSSKN